MMKQFKDLKSGDNIYYVRGNYTVQKFEIKSIIFKKNEGHNTHYQIVTTDLIHFNNITNENPYDDILSRLYPDYESVKETICWRLKDLDKLKKDVEKLKPRKDKIKTFLDNIL